MERGPHLLLHGRRERGARALSGLQPGLRLQVQRHVPLRPHRHRHQARRGQLRRHRLHRLHHLGGAVGHSRRDRPGVPGQLQRPALHPPHQRIRLRRGRPGAAVQALVRPQRRVPHLLHRLEPQAHHDRGGRRDDPVVRQQPGARRAVPVVAAAAGVREPVERRRLGDAGRARQDGLEAGALRLLLPQLQHHPLPAVAGRVVVRRRARRVPALQPLPQGARRPAVGARHGLRHLRLLRRREQPVQRHHQAQGVLAPAPAMKILLVWFEVARGLSDRFIVWVDTHTVSSTDYFCTSEETGTCGAAGLILSLDF